ncbi:MAG: hypothetical protein AAF414_17495 [Pseudomonadota bacterium]
MRKLLLIFISWISLVPSAAMALTGEERCVAAPTHACVNDLLVQAIIEIDDAPTRTSYLDDLISRSMYSGAMAEALELGRLIEDPEVRLRAIRPLSHHLTAQPFESPRDNKLLNDEVALIQDQLRILSEDADFHTTLARDFARRGSMARAISQATEIELVSRRVETLSELTVIALGAGDRSDVELAFASAWRAVGELTDVLSATRVLLPLIRTHVEHGSDQDPAAHALTIPFLTNRVYALLFIAGHQFELARDLAALNTLTFARDAAVQNQGPSVDANTRANLLAEIANAQFSYGDRAAHDETYGIASELRSAELDLLDPVLSVYVNPSDDTISAGLRFALEFEDDVLRALALLILVDQIPTE